MKRKVPPYGTYEKKSSSYIPNISVNCVTLGFHEGSIKVLLGKLKVADKWMLPGGFVGIDEDIESSARRVLYKRTGLKDIYLKQFYLFGQRERTNIVDNATLLENLKDVSEEDKEWYLGRFLTIGYYALIKYNKAEVVAGLHEDLQWFSLNDLPDMFFDHGVIIKTALDTIRMQLGYVPLGYELLPDSFTMPELRTIYEEILGREIDRRNFQRKMLSIGLIEPLNRTRKSGAHKAPNLYTFIEKKYEEAEELGLQLMSKNL